MAVDHELPHGAPDLIGNPFEKWDQKFSTERCVMICLLFLIVSLCLFVFFF